MKRLTVLIITAVLLVTLAGCSVPKTGKNNINKYTYAKDNKPAEAVTLSDSDFEDLQTENAYYDNKYSIDEVNEKFDLGTIRQTVDEDTGNFIAYSIFDNSKGDRLYVFYDSGLYVNGEYTEGWGIMQVVKYSKNTKRWSNSELKKLVNKLDYPEE